MSLEKNCDWCGLVFTPTHGNDGCCGDECAYEKKKARQKEKRDAVKKFFPIMFQNNEMLEEMYDAGILEPTIKELENYGVDVSMCRYCHSTEGSNGIMLDAGAYYLITETNFQTFKLFKHDTESATF
jgi:hypothetical protein